METIYERPEDYDLEHAGDDQDIEFYLELIHRWRPQRVLELASGSGRVCIPLARAVARSGIQVIGLERTGPMLDECHRKWATLDEHVRECLSFIPADMREWQVQQPVDLVIAPCSSLSHLTTLDDQIAAWQGVFANLTLGPFTPTHANAATSTRRNRCRYSGSENRNATSSLQDDTIPSARAAG